MTDEVLDKRLNPQKSKQEKKIISMNGNKSVEIVHPLQQKFSSDEQIVIIQKITKWDNLYMVLIPNIGEIIRLFVSLGITYILSLILQFPFLSITMIKFFGMTALSVYAYTWGYAGPFHYRTRIDRIREELYAGKKVFIDFKIFGFIISIIILIIGIKLDPLTS
ncbi:MAG: hypothetical protein ACW99A_20375 [Candidatus Kariarchaeaceae archaeon]|jgi:hypothetical protein